MSDQQIPKKIKDCYQGDCKDKVSRCHINDLLDSEAWLQRDLVSLQKRINDAVDRIRSLEWRYHSHDPLSDDTLKTMPKLCVSIKKSFWRKCERIGEILCEDGQIKRCISDEEITELKELIK